MTIADITKNLPLLLVTALLFALIGWWLRGRRKTVPAATATPASLKSSAGPSNSERQRLREVEAKLRTCESAAESAGAALASLKKTSVALTEHEALRTELEIARTNAAALDTQLKKSREIQAGLQAQANDAGKKVQARAITLENDLAAARTDIQRLKTLSEPNTEGMKRLEAEIETVRTRLRAVEAQLAERNAELNAQKASALAATVRLPRTVAARETSPGGALNLLGVESKSDPIPASAAVAKAVQPGSTNREATELPTDTGALPLPGQAAKPEALLSLPTSAVDSKEPPAVRSVSSSPGAATQQELPLLKLTFADTILLEDSLPENPVAGFAATHPVISASADDLKNASAVLGKRIKSDDLTIIEGIGPKISELLIAAGVNTWEALASAQTEQLQSILTAAGPAFAIHHPETWPAQARLAADAKWLELKALQEQLDGGRTSGADYTPNG